MTIDEAIKVLTALANHRTEILKNPEIHAARLGIEALKLVKKCRHSPNSWFVKELPGETRD